MINIGEKKLNKISFFGGGYAGSALKTGFFLFGTFFLAVFIFMLMPPLDFPSGTLVRIERGESLADIAQSLKKESVIRSEFLFKVFVVTIAGQGGALSGDYFFENKQSLLKVARRISRGIYGLSPISVRFPEGATVKEMSDILGEKIPNFNKEKFLNLATAKEGFLFPDTYFFLPNIEPEQVIREMIKVFKKRTEIFAEKIKQQNKNFKDIVIMASILEKEGIKLKDKKIIAGILWKRLEIGMPLQVDAPFIYERNKNTFELTLDDLRKDSAYNTYTNKGLPPSAISNPGLDSIRAAVEPTRSPYLFYLSDNSGKIYYAENYQKHLQYKAKYID